jgi:hypothetical protein
MRCPPATGHLLGFPEESLQEHEFDPMRPPLAEKVNLDLESVV